jgi:hypothetical protein
MSYDSGIQTPWRIVLHKHHQLNFGQLLHASSLSADFSMLSESKKMDINICYSSFGTTHPSTQ